LRRLQIYPVKDMNSMRYWTKVNHPLRIAYNFLVIQFFRFIPFLEFKNRALRLLLQMQIGKNTSVGIGVIFDFFYPGSIIIGDDVILGYNCTILCHEFLPREYRLGEVYIGNGVLIGANSTILAGVSVGEGAIIGAGSLVNTDIPPNTLAAGVPARVIKKLN